MFCFFVFLTMTNNISNLRCILETWIQMFTVCFIIYTFDSPPAKIIPFCTICTAMSTLGRHSEHSWYQCQIYLGVIPGNWENWSQSHYYTDASDFIVYKCFGMNTDTQTCTEHPPQFICRVHLISPARVQTGQILWSVTDEWRHTPQRWNKAEIDMITPHSDPPAPPSHPMTPTSANMGQKDLTARRWALGCPA